MTSKPQLREPRFCWLVGTAKGAFVLRTRGQRSQVDVEGPIELGAGIGDFVQDYRDRSRLVMTVGGGHLGPTVRCSGDGGRTWRESKLPPQFGLPPKGQRRRGAQGKAVRRNFWLTPGHVSEPGVWYLGTVPMGLFRSEDHGDTWRGVDGLNLHPKYRRWFSFEEPPDGPFLHSILVDPRDPKRLQLSASVGGTFESHDAGQSWRPLNAGVESDFGPERFAEFGQIRTA